MAYFGPAKEAKRYFMDMGYEPLNRQTTPDFLVACTSRDCLSLGLCAHDPHTATDPRGRKIRPGFQGIIPRTADETAAHFRASAYGQLNRSSMDSYTNNYVNKPELKSAYDASATREHAQHALNTQSYTLSIPMQVRAVMGRRWQILKGDWATQAVQWGSVFHRIDSARLICHEQLQITDITGNFHRDSVPPPCQQHECILFAGEFALLVCTSCETQMEVH